MRPYQTIAVLLLLAGCAQQSATGVWQKSGASQAGMTNALNACNVQAVQQYPVNLQQVQVAAGYNSAAGSGCGFTPSSGTQACASGGNYVQPQTAQKDVNLGPRNQAVSTCMQAAGWTGG